jgi:hypothetical protein
MKPKSLFLILASATLIVILVSWYVFHWTFTLGGIILLIVGAIEGVVFFGNNLVSLVKNWASLNKSHSPTVEHLPKPNQTQEVVDSERVDQYQKSHGANQKQKVTNSSDVKQHQE